MSFWWFVRAPGIYPGNKKNLREEQREEREINKRRNFGCYEVTERRFTAIGPAKTDLTSPTRRWRGGWWWWRMRRGGSGSSGGSSGRMGELLDAAGAGWEAEAVSLCMHRLLLARFTTGWRAALWWWRTEESMVTRWLHICYRHASHVHGVATFPPRVDSESENSRSNFNYACRQLTWTAYPQTLLLMFVILVFQWRRDLMNHVEFFAVHWTWRQLLTISNPQSVSLISFGYFICYMMIVISVLLPNESNQSFVDNLIPKKM